MSRHPHVWFEVTGYNTDREMFVSYPPEQLASYPEVPIGTRFPHRPHNPKLKYRVVAVDPEGQYVSLPSDVEPKLSRELRHMQECDECFPYRTSIDDRKAPGS